MTPIELFMNINNNDIMIMLSMESLWDSKFLSDSKYSHKWHKALILLFSSSPAWEVISVSVKFQSSKILPVSWPLACKSLILSMTACAFNLNFAAISSRMTTLLVWK